MIGRGSCQQTNKQTRLWLVEDRWSSQKHVRVTDLAARLNPYPAKLWRSNVEKMVCFKRKPDKKNSGKCQTNWGKHVIEGNNICVHTIHIQRKEAKQIANKIFQVRGEELARVREELRLGWGWLFCCADDFVADGDDFADSDDFPDGWFLANSDIEGGAE